VRASIASGSFATDGMIVAPCSMKTLAAIATGYADNLTARAADVTLKERRRLVLLVREAPLTLQHLRNMVAVTEMGGIVFPPVPAFYAGLDSIEARVDQTVGRVLDLFGIESPLVRRWTGVRDDARDCPAAACRERVSLAARLAAGGSTPVGLLREDEPDVLVLGVPLREHERVLRRHRAVHDERPHLL